MQMRRFFESGVTKPYAYRKAQLIKLRDAVKKHEKEIHKALDIDLKKNPEESWASETGLILAEIRYALKHLKNWMQPENVSTNLVNLPSKSFVMQEPLGVVMIIAPWNYPFLLLLTPLVGSIAAGNCAIIKPSESVAATSTVVKKIIEENFDKDFICVVEGDGATVIPAMMNNFTFDHVFFTGGPKTGKLIYKMAAERLVPVTLELGGKSPCIVEEDANIKVAAKRIVLTKFLNAGQTCVAPDYILVSELKKNALIDELKKVMLQFYSDKAEDCYHYGKMVNENHFDKVVTYLQHGRILLGGRHDKEKLFIEPTLVDDVSLESDIMKDEIFGPILPVVTFNTREEALSIIALNKNPLAFYVFTSSKKNEKFWLNNVAFGGGCVNNSSWHLANYNLPFGGRGASGNGHYHGKYSFDKFSHKKAVMKTPTWFDPAIKYPPLKGKLKLFKMLIR